MTAEVYLVIYLYWRGYKTCETMGAGSSVVDQAQKS